MATLHIALVVAAARNGVIGCDNAIPWHLGSDLRRFKALTMGKPMVMGRKTFQAIGRVLPGRASVVVTRDPGFAAAGAQIVHSLGEALRQAGELATISGADEISVIGGSEIFRLALPLADRLYLTEVDAAPPGDATFPPIDPAQWHEVRREVRPAGPGDDHAFVFVDYERHAPAAAVIPPRS